MKCGLNESSFSTAASTVVVEVDMALVRMEKGSSAEVAPLGPIVGIKCGMVSSDESLVNVLNWLDELGDKDRRVQQYFEAAMVADLVVFIVGACAV